MIKIKPKNVAFQIALLGLGATTSFDALALTAPTASNDSTNIYYKLSYSGTPTNFQFFLDSDASSSSGYAISGLGANYLIENGNLYKFSGSSSSTWGWTFVKTITWSQANGVANASLLKTDLGNPSKILLVGRVSSPVDTSSVVTEVITSPSPSPSVVAPNWVKCASENGTCTFSGTHTVRYGTGTKWTTKVATGSIACNNATFGDPAYGYAKECDVDMSSSPAPLPSPSVTPSPSPTIKPSPSPTVSPSPSPTTSSQPFTAPALVNPVSPVSYGAKCDGVTDDTAAFQSAVNASDVLVPAGKTCVINNQVSITVSNRHIQCGTGALLKKTAVNGTRMFNYYSPSGGRLSGDSIVNCSFLGANTMPPQADWNTPNKHWDIPIETQDRVDHFFLAGNTFERFWGQAMFQTYGAVDGGSGDQIIYNTFKNCAYYGPVFVAHKNGYMAHNTLVDCAAGVENDDPSQYTGGNIIEYNTLGCVYGYGGPDMGACAMLTGGCTSNGADYTGNTVQYNVITGKSNGQGYQPAQQSRLINATQGWGAKGAKYISNTCNNGCFYTP